MREKLRALRLLIQKPVSLRRRLIVLVVATLAPLVIFAVSMIVRASDQERRTFERGAIDLARALTTAIESKLRSPITTLEALATSPSLTDDELAVFRERSGRVLKSQREWATITLALPSGKRVMDARYGYPLGAETGATPHERWSFEEVLRTNRPVIGHLIQEPSSMQYQFPVRVPVVRDGAVKYVLTAVLLPSFLKDVLDDQRLPPDWVGVLLDGNRRFVARTVEPERNLGQLASESLRAALDRSSEGWFRGTTLEGRDVYTPFNRSSFSGWTVALGIPAGFVDATFRRSLIYVVLFAGGLLALGLLLAWSVSARTVASINSLVRTANDLGSGKNLSEEAPSSIVEVEAVRRAFVIANRMLSEQSAEKDRLAGRLDLALTVGNIGVHEWRPQTNEFIWDDRMRAHWGLPPGVAINNEIFLQGIHRDDRDGLLAARRRALDPKSDGQYHAEFRVVGIEDHVERWLESRSRVDFESGQAIRLSGTTIDITALKSFQAELERQVQERTVRLQETVGELEAYSYSVSHDMRAPLRAMEGYAKALLTDYYDRLDPDGRHWLDRIVRSAHRLDALITDVLAYSRVAKEDIELSPVDLERLIDDIISTHPEFQAPLAQIVIEKPLHRVIGHEAYLTQCVTNLLGNAVKFVADGVVPEIRIRSEPLNGKVRVWFEDNGIGIDPQHHERIFQIFGQVYTPERFRGTGIGLAIVRKAAQRMQGEVGVESQLNKGSRLWLILEGDGIAGHRHSGN